MRLIASGMTPLTIARSARISTSLEKTRRMACSRGRPAPSSAGLGRVGRDFRYLTPGSPVKAGPAAPKGALSCVGLLGPALTFQYEDWLLVAPQRIADRWVVHLGCRLSVVSGILLVEWNEL